MNRAIEAAAGKKERDNALSCGGW